MEVNKVNFSDFAEVWRIGIIFGELLGDIQNKSLNKLGIWINYKIPVSMINIACEWLKINMKDMDWYHKNGKRRQI